WTAPPRGAPEGGPAVGAVGRAVLHSPPGPRGGSPPRRPRSPPAAEDLDRSTPHAPPKSSIHSRAALSGRAGRRGRSTAPCSTAGAFSGAPATKARGFRPEPSPTPTRALYVVTALDGDDDAGGSISKDFVRIPRNEAHADTHAPSGSWDSTDPDESPSPARSSASSSRRRRGSTNLRGAYAAP